MLGYWLVGIIYSVYFVSAQQNGPIPSRPQQFAKATLMQAERPNNRQRSVIASRPVPEPIPSLDKAQVIQLKRTQSVRKIKPQLTQPQMVDQQRANLIDDISARFPNKIVAQTPLPLFQTQSPKLTPRPVEEEISEDEEVPTTILMTPSTTTYTVPLRSNYVPVPALSPEPVSLPQNPASSGFQRTQFIQPSAFRPALVHQTPPAQFAAPVVEGKQLIRQQVRPVHGVQVPVMRQPITQLLPSPQYATEEDQYLRPGQNRAFKKQEAVRQHVVEREPIRQQLVRQQPARTQVDYAQTAKREPQVKTSQRERKPVAQTIRKYHEEHEDGSITWGYENDDGSFKEETIGVDCVTRGKYGYFDPDGVKREYTYQTGIPCEKAQESEEAASNQGFIDYTNNKYVLPNGDEIDLEAMVKNRARKPVSRYTNRT